MRKASRLLFFVLGLAVTSVQKVSASNGLQISFGEGYAASLSQSHLSMADAVGLNVSVVYPISLTLAAGGEYADYLNSGPSLGLASFKVGRSFRLVRPYFLGGVGIMARKFLGTGPAGKLGIGLTLFNLSPPLPRISLGWEIALVRGLGNVGQISYLNNALMFAVNF